MQYLIDLHESKAQQNEEKKWENPVEPSKASDCRDEEQLLRQYDEAKRRKENLTNGEREKKINKRK